MEKYGQIDLGQYLEDCSLSIYRPDYLRSCTVDSIIETFMIYALVRSISLDLTLYDVIRNERNNIAQKANEVKERFEFGLQQNAAIQQLSINIAEIQCTQLMLYTQNHEMALQQLQTAHNAHLEEIHLDIDRIREAMRQEAREAMRREAMHQAAMVINDARNMLKLGIVCLAIWPFMRLFGNGNNIHYPS